MSESEKVAMKLYNMWVMARKKAGLHIESEESDIGLAKTNIYWAKEITRILEEQYPHHLWQVRVDMDRTCRYAIISLPRLHVGTEGYVLNMEKCEKDVNLFKIECVRAGGEILERFDIKRGERADDCYQMIIANRPMAPFLRMPT